MSALTDAIDRLLNFYNDGIYDVVDNPGGFDRGGHRLNFVNLGRDVALVGAAAAGDFLSALTTPTVLTATGNIAATDVVVQTNQAGSIVLTLPASETWAANNGKYGLPLSIFDISGTASTNNVTLNTSGGQTISGFASGELAITTDYGGFNLEPKFGGGWIVV